MTHHIILADDQAIFRAGASRVLSLEEDIRIVGQCENPEKLGLSAEANRGCIVVAACSLHLDLNRLSARLHSFGSRLVMVTENSDPPTDEMTHLAHGIVARNVTSAELLDCIRRVGRGERYVQRSNLAMMQAPDAVGTRVRDSLTPREMQIVAQIVQGCKNKDIAVQLGIKEQVVKNYLRSIYDKTGVSDRLELALFTIHHRVLAEAAAKAGTLLQMRSA